MTASDLYTIDRKRAVCAANEAMSLVYGKLTDAEREALILLAKGFKRAEAAQQTGGTADEQSVRRHSIFRKLEVNTAPEAAVIAAKAGLV